VIVVSGIVGYVVGEYRGVLGEKYISMKLGSSLEEWCIVVSERYIGEWRYWKCIRMIEKVYCCECEAYWNSGSEGVLL
jgi:hypothetical protein